MPDGRVGNEFPATVVDYVDLSAARFVYGIEHPAARPATASTRFVDYRNSARLPGTLYLPQALGLAAARSLEMPVSQALYMARLFNLLTTSLLLALALVRLPFGHATGAAVFLLPMALSLRASLSADALTLAFTALFVAEAARLAFAESEQPPRSSPGLLLAALALGFAKVVYLPLLLLVMPPTGSNRVRRGWLLAFLATALALLASLPGLLIAAQLPGSLRLDRAVEPSSNLALLRAEPLATIARLAGDLVAHAPRYAAEAIGSHLGWLDVPLGGLPTLTIGILLLTLALGSRPPIVLERVAVQRFSFHALAAAFGAVAAIEFVMFLQWTPRESLGVEGTQGRYFLPLGLPLGLVLAGLLQGRPGLSARASALVVVVAALIGTVCGLAAIAARYS